ncbi:hypothetical protein N7447_009244 [Penicillium robsamsonii]|uniref:uncharacterized protein n=1 Tax=Penicillium robsamsonii TaxID=1792511 RepID=UPI002548D340|nr:uncharacterized protein N7447_009244 [Penicillium robsamsonii]KAJ5817011.1 hypothetical protein N7447_009244 [Penicillium robsamsonii]
MRFYTIALLAGATAVAANSATLLLPGFAGQDLQASIMETNGDATTYKITCPKTADACGIVGDGMTAIAAPTSVQLKNINLQGTVGTVSCNVAGTTYASCHASAGTVTPSGTLGPDDLNWMPVTISTKHTATSTTTTKAPTSTTTTQVTTTTSTTTPAITSTSTLVSTPKKSSSLIASATSSTPLAAASTSAAAETGAPASSSTPFNAAGQLAGSIWTVGGAFMALACAFA